MKKKICFLCHSQKDLGTYNTVKEYISLISNQFEIIFIYTSKNRISFNLSKKIKPNLIEYILPRLQYGKYFSFQTIRMVISIILIFKHNPDTLVYTANAHPNTTIPAILFKILKKKSVSINLWDDIWHDGFGKQHHKIINFIFGFFEKLSLKFTDKLIFINEDIKDFIFKKYKINKFDYEIIYYPLNTLTYNQNPYKDKSKINIFLGGNTFENSFFKIFENLLISLKDKANFYIAGNIDEQITERLCVYSNFKDLGFIPQLDFKNYVYHSDIILLPMSDDDYQKYRFPVRVCDFINSKGAIVSYASGFLKKTIIKYKYGMLVPENTFKSYHQSIINLLNNKIVFDKKPIKNLFNRNIIADKLVKFL